MNNLYRWGMNGYLPYAGFKWLKNVNNFDVNSVSEKTPIGYIFKADLEYPAELHKFHNDYPLAPEKLTIPYDILSGYCKKIADEYVKRVGDAKKLIPSIGCKSNVVYYKNLQLYLSLVMKLSKIHEVSKLKQSDWVKKYIDFNTEKKQMLLTVLRKIFFKLIINSVYGKKMEIYEKEPMLG